MANYRDDRKTYGLLGRNTSYSLSPAMHNAAFRHFGIPAEYELFDVNENELGDFLRGRVLTGRISGFNVTVPYKIRFKEMLEDRTDCTVVIGDDAGFLGAINTVRIRGENIDVFNTDGRGFYESLKETGNFGPEELKGQNFFVMGAGGAGRAISMYLALLSGDSPKVFIHDVDDGKLSFVESGSDRGITADRVFAVKTGDVPGKIEECRFIINATPLGTKEGDPSPVPLDCLRKGQVVYDLVYTRETELIRRAREKGLIAAGGLGMLINQGALSFNIWTQRPFEETKKVMKEAALGELEKRKATGKEPGKK